MSCGATSPASVGAATIAQLYRKRWRIGGMFGRLESVLHSERRTLGPPRAALLGFAAAVLALNVLALLKRSVEQVHSQSAPDLDVSTYQLGVLVSSDSQGMLIVLPPEVWQPWSRAWAGEVAQYLLCLADSVSPRSVATAKRGLKKEKPGGAWLARSLANNCPQLVFSSRLRGNDLERDGS